MVRYTRDRFFRDLLAKQDIAIVELRGYANGKHVDDFGPCYRFGCDRNYRFAIVRIDMQTFQSCQWGWLRGFLIAYRGATFHVTPPPLAAYRTTIWDAIGHLGDRGPDDATDPANATLEAIAEQLPNGGTLSNFRPYWPGTLPEWPHGDVYRPQWLLGYGVCHGPGIGDVLPRWTTVIHPTYNRALNYLEWQWIESNTLDGWLSQQLQLFRSKHWGSQDWESRYDIISRQWVGGNVTPDTRVKHFDLQCYRPLENYPHVLPDEHKPRLFNLDRQGNLIYSSDVIKRHRQEYLRAERNKS
jgi:hypothetical protein